MSNICLCTSHLYILFDCNLESLFPFQFVSFYGSISFQLAFHCRSAKYRIESVNLLRDVTASAEDALVFQLKIKKLEQDSVSEANCKTKERNKKRQLVKFFYRCYSAMRAKLRIVQLLLLSFAVFIKVEVTSSLSTTLQHSIYALKQQLPRATPCSIYILNYGSLCKHPRGIRK